MTNALQTVAVSLVFLLWDACQRARTSHPLSELAETPADGDELVEHRLECLSLLARPVPGQDRR
jgi:hypothetical protein